MPTLNEITEGHSKRLSRITQLRDGRLRDAIETRDRHLRALPAAAKAYAAFDDAIADARGRQLATDARADAARAAAHQEFGTMLAAALANAQRVRREADAASLEKRRKAEEDAEHEFVLALAAGPARPSTDAQKIRAEKLEKAKKEFDAAVAATQEQFRQSREAALANESRGDRDAERTFADAVRVGETVLRGATSAAEQELASALAKIPEAAAILESWRAAVAAIAHEAAQAEQEAFSRFRRELDAAKA